MGGIENGTSGARIKILRPLFNTNAPLKPPFRHFGNHFGPRKSDFWQFYLFWKTQLFSQIIDQKEQKNNRYKFGGATWCYKPHPTVQVFCKDRWKVGERIFFCLSLLSGCKGTICFCPSFLLRRNIFQLEWSFPQKGEKFMFSFQATVSFPAFCTPHVYHHPSTVESGVLTSNFSWENSQQGLVNCH